MMWRFFESGLFEIFFSITFLIIMGMSVFGLISSVRQWSKNHSDHTAGHSSTSYYVTFQVESGDRMELRVSGREYGLLAEGDRGRLTFQGTRYLSFVRSV